MNKTLIAMSFLVLMNSSPVLASIDRYVSDVEKTSDQYSLDMKVFLRSLDPKITQFNTQQQTQFCSIVKKYVDDMYLTTDQNRQFLPPSAQSMTKQNIIDKVMTSPEMQLLQRYNIQCILN